MSWCLHDPLAVLNPPNSVAETSFRARIFEQNVFVKCLFPLGMAEQLSDRRIVSFPDNVHLLFLHWFWRRIVWKLPEMVGDSADSYHARKHFWLHAWVHNGQDGYGHCGSEPDTDVVSSWLWHVLVAERREGNSDVPRHHQSLPICDWKPVESSPAQRCLRRFGLRCLRLHFLRKGDSN